MVPMIDDNYLPGLRASDVDPTIAMRSE